MSFQIKLAEHILELQNIYPELERYCREYLVESEEAEISLGWTEQEILEERKNIELRENLSLPYLETLTALRKIAEIFPNRDCFLFHGAAITYADAGYLFAAPSGTGKSTHISTWKRYLGEAVDIVNGDKPILSVEKDEKTGEVRVKVHGTPWAGKEHWQKNRSADLKGICFLRRNTENRIRQLQPIECLDMLMNQVYLPADAGALGRTMELLDWMVTNVPVYLLECDRSEEAVRCSFEALTGQDYNEACGGIL